MKLSVKDQFAAAIVALLKIAPIENISVEDILRETGLSRTTFYRHFRDKFDLMFYVLQKELDHIYTPDCDLGQSGERMTTLLVFIRENHRYFKSILSYEGQNCFRAQFFAKIEHLHLNRYRRIWGTKVPDEIAFHLRFHAAGTTWAILEWLARDCVQSPDTLGQQILAARSALMDRVLHPKEKQSL